MKTINKIILAVTVLLSITINVSAAQIKNAKTETFKVYGNCETCKTRIETVADKKGISEGTWNADTKMLVLTYNSEKITPDEILKQIAYAGHDNDKYLAPDDAYAKLPGCCKYERKKVETISPEIDSVKTEATKIETVETEIALIDTTKKVTVNVNPLADVFASYFALKDALAKDDAATAGLKAKALFAAIDKADMSKMSAGQHSVWMKYEQKLSYDAEHIKGSTDIAHQREHFVSLSSNMYEVMKVFKTDVTVYYDFCPMANEGKGATWLSLEEKISNPYMGKKMPACGSVQETITK